jgi:hypothetical protein
MKTKTSNSVIVVAPECPAELIPELLSAGILPSDTDCLVLLPPSNRREYDHLVDQSRSFDRTQFLASPGQGFFSTTHLKWLQDHLRSSGNIKLLIFKSPYKDLKTTLLSLLVMFMSGKTITLLFATPEAAIDLNGQGFSERWICQDLNLEITLRELHRIFLFLTPWDILYFLMFFGLVIKQSVSKSLSKLLRKGQLILMSLS